MSSYNAQDFAKRLHGTIVFAGAREVKLQGSNLVRSGEPIVHATLRLGSNSFNVQALPGELRYGKASGWFKIDNSKLNLNYAGRKDHLIRQIIDERKRLSDKVSALTNLLRVVESNF